MIKKVQNPKECITYRVDYIEKRKYKNQNKHKISNKV